MLWIFFCEKRRKEMEKNKNKHTEIKEEDLPKREDFKSEEEYLEYMDQYLESIGYFENEYEERDGKKVRKPKKLIPCKRLVKKLETFFGDKIVTDPKKIKYLRENASEFISFDDDSFLYNDDDNDDKIVLNFDENGLHDFKAAKRKKKIVTKNEKIDSLRSDTVDKILELIQHNTSWQSDSYNNRPVEFPKDINGEKFGRIQSLILMHETLKYGYRAACWLTALEVQKRGRQIIKGAKPAIITYFNFTGIFHLEYYNEEQCIIRLKRLDYQKFLEIMEKNKDRCDEIKEEDLPKREDFKSEEEYLEYMDQYLESIGYFEEKYEEIDGKMVRKPKKWIDCKRNRKKYEDWVMEYGVVIDPDDYDEVKHFEEHSDVGEGIVIDNDSFLYDKDYYTEIVTYNAKDTYDYLDKVADYWKNVEGENSDTKRKK